MFLQLHVTGNCNLRCRHCYIAGHSTDMPYKDVKAALAQFDKLVEAVAEKSGEKVVAHIHITGGEPFLHPEIRRILRLLIKKRGKYRYGIMSNGTLLTKKDLVLLRRLRLKAFQVSLDGVEATHDSLRGDGNFKKVVAALDLLKENGIPARVSFTANKSNFAEFPLLAEICREHGVKSLWSDRFIPFGHSRTVEPLDENDMREYVAILKRERENGLNAASGLSVQNYRALQFIGSCDEPYYCHAGEKLIAVDEHGDIFPCRRLPVKCGNIRENLLTDVYFGDPTFVALREYGVSGKCLSCSHAEKCRGGERCFSYAVAGRYDVPDPCCFIEE